MFISCLHSLLLFLFPSQSKTLYDFNLLKFTETYFSQSVVCLVNAPRAAAKRRSALALFSIHKISCVDGVVHSFLSLRSFMYLFYKLFKEECKTL